MSTSIPGNNCGKKGRVMITPKCPIKVYGECVFYSGDIISSAGINTGDSIDDCINKLSTSAGTGSVTSVALTVPSAFSVSGSPITTSGTLAISAIGTSSQFIRGDGTLATDPCPELFGSGHIPFADSFGILTSNNDLSWNNSSKLLTLGAGSSVGRVIITNNGTSSNDDVISVTANTSSFKRYTITNNGTGASSAAGVLAFNNLAHGIFFAISGSGNTSVGADLGYMRSTGANGLYLAANTGPITLGVSSSFNASTEYARFENTTGHLGLGTKTPTAILHIKGGTAAANTAPLKLTAGTNLTTPENGAFEFDGTNLYFTVGGVRKTIQLI